jgi:phage tail-like protein
MTDDKQVSSYLDHLPAVFRQDAFLGRFLLAFETLLSQPPLDAPQPALEEMIEDIAHFFRPSETPAEFLPWLAGWVALSLREDWEEDTKRKFLQEIVPLYRKRGTKDGLESMLRIYIGEDVPITIYDTDGDFEKFEPPAHFFQVEMTVRDRDPVLLQHRQQIAMAIIEQEKPAHTFYALQIMIPTMRLMSEALLEREGGEPLILGENTLLGTQNMSTLGEGGTP